VLTELVAYSDSAFIVKAEVWRDQADIGPASTGFAEERVGSGPVNRTSALENCETSAVGRALANLNYAPKGARPSREEMGKEARYAQADHEQLVAEVVEVDPGKVSRGRPATPEQGWSAGQDAPFKATPKQLKMIGSLFTSAGVVSRQARLDRTALIVGHPLGSSRDLTVGEASKVIDELKAAE
jgi:hypothetical protein